VGVVSRAIVRKYGGPVPTDTVDVASTASVTVTSENELFPIDHVFDGRSGPGGSCWTAASSGEQTIDLRFRVPVDVASLVLEVEERERTCEVQLDVSLWFDGQPTPTAAPRRVLAFSPYGPSFHRESWTITERGVTHVAIRVTPLSAGRVASLTSIILR
jgi:hypothetical protein